MLVPRISPVCNILAPRRIPRSGLALVLALAPGSLNPASESWTWRCRRFRGPPRNPIAQSTEPQRTPLALPDSVTAQDLPATFRRDDTVASRYEGDRLLPRSRLWPRCCTTGRRWEAAGPRLSAGETPWGVRRLRVPVMPASILRSGVASIARGVHCAGSKLTCTRGGQGLEQPGFERRRADVVSGAPDVLVL